LTVTQDDLEGKETMRKAVTASTIVLLASVGVVGIASSAVSAMPGSGTSSDPTQPAALSSPDQTNEVSLPQLHNEVSLIAPPPFEPEAETLAQEDWLDRYIISAETALAPVRIDIDNS
jgi:hypothetical protein